MAGIVASWSDRSPIRCICPECGRRQETRRLYQFNPPPPGPIEIMVWSTLLAGVILFVFGSITLPLLMDAIFDEF